MGQPQADASDAASGGAKGGSAVERLVGTGGADLDQVLPLLLRRAGTGASRQQGEAGQEPKPPGPAPEGVWVGSHGSNRYGRQGDLTRSGVTSG